MTNSRHVKRDNPMTMGAASPKGRPYLRGGETTQPQCTTTRNHNAEETHYKGREREE